MITRHFQNQLHRWIHHFPPSSSLLCVSQWSCDRCVYQSSGESRGIKRRADVCSCRPDYGVEWMVGEPAEFVCTGSFHEGYTGVTVGSGGGRRGRVESYDLKESFLWSVCQGAPQQTQSQVSLVLLAELMRACALRAGALMFWVAGSLCFLSCSLSLPVPHQKWKGSWDTDVSKHVFIHFIHPLLHTPFVCRFCSSTVHKARSYLSIFISNQTHQVTMLYTYNHPANQSG